MKDKKKGFNINIIITIAIIVIAILFVGLAAAIGINKYKNRNKVFVDGLVITDTKISKDGDYYRFEAKVTAEEAKKVKKITVIFKDKNDKVIITTNNILNKDFKVGDYTTIISKTDVDINASKKIEYKVE